MERRILALSVLAALVAIHVVSAMRIPVGAFNDDALFILLAKALRQGAFAWPDAAGRPLSDPLPGFPLLLTLPVWAVEPAWGVLRGVGVASAWACVLLTWRIARRHLPPAWAVSAAALAAVNPVLVGLGGLVIPDTAFVALALALFLLLPECASSRTARIALAAGAGFAALIRPQGALLVLSLAASLWYIRGPLLGLGFFISAFLPLGFWSLRNEYHAASLSGFLDNWRSQIVRFQDPSRQSDHAGRLIASLFGEGFLGLADIPFPVQFLAGSLVLVLAALGTIRLLRQSKDRGGMGVQVFAMAAFSALLLCLHATWELTEARYLLPLMPLLWILALGAVRPTFSGRPVLAGAALVLLLFPALGVDLLFVRAGAVAAPSYQPRTMGWLRRRLPPKTRLQGSAFHTVTLLTGRVCTPPPQNVRTSEEWLASARAEKVDFVLSAIEPFGAEFSFPRLAWLNEPQLAQWARKEGLPEVFRSEEEGTTIYQLNPKPGVP